ncbi:permease, partial [Streptosporangium subroseum]|uniref:permease n=1 Tax=Streptosporangium subroseum TaxID=106412 RepID=UPI003F4DADF8
MLLVVGRFALTPHLTAPALQTWATIFVAICVQALPFLVFGVALSAAITAFVPASFWTRALPRHPALAVPVAGMAGAVLPGCECASVPVASGLMARGVAPSAALAFLLASPAI